MCRVTGSLQRNCTVVLRMRECEGAVKGRECEGAVSVDRCYGRGLRAPAKEG